MIEAVSYRPTLHATADDVSRYRDDGEAARARHNNCLARYENYLVRHGLLDAARIEGFRQQALDAMAAAIAEAEALPLGGASDVFDNVYVQAPSWFARDASDLADSRGAAGEGAAR